MIDVLLKFCRGMFAIVEHEIGLATQIGGEQPVLSEFYFARRLQKIDCPVWIFALQGYRCTDYREPVSLD